MYKGIKPINLQLFAEGEPALSIDSPEVDSQVMNLFNADNSQQTEEPADPGAQQEQEPQPAQETTPQQEQSLPENFKSVEDVVKSFKSAQSELTKKSQQLADVNRMYEAMKADYEARTRAQAPQEPPQKDELEGLNPEAVLEQFYSDPMGLLTKIIERSMESKIKPLENKLNPVIEHTEAQRNYELWNSAVTEFNSANPDMSEFLDGMKQYISDNGLQNSTEPARVLQNAYLYARGMKYTSPASLLSDQKFIEEHILTNQAITEAAIKAHMAKVKGTQVPPSISGAGGANILTPPPSAPTSIEEAGEQFESMLRGNFG